MNQPPGNGAPPYPPGAPQGPQQAQSPSRVGGAPQRPFGGTQVMAEAPGYPYPHGQMPPGPPSSLPPGQAPSSRPYTPPAAPGYGLPSAQPPYGGPGMPPPAEYVAAAQEFGPATGQAPQIQNPQVGLSLGPGGRPRLHYAGGDFTPGALLATVTKGTGYHKPRLVGLGFIGVATLFAVINIVMIYVLDLIYIYSAALVPPFLFAGSWLVVTGQPRATSDGTPAPLWSRIGLGAFLAVGLALGLFYVIADI
jgi:hypothetical protein